jgi:hypothetical protein
MFIIDFQFVVQSTSSAFVANRVEETDIVRKMYVNERDRERAH